MAIITYVTPCPCCGLEVEAEISVSPEQQGKPETEYLPKHWEIEDVVCGCGYAFDLAEARAVLSAARRYYGT